MEFLQKKEQKKKKKRKEKEKTGEHRKDTILGLLVKMKRTTKESEEDLRVSCMRRVHIFLFGAGAVPS